MCLLIYYALFVVGFFRTLLQVSHIDFHSFFPFFLLIDNLVTGTVALTASKNGGQSWFVNSDLKEPDIGAIHTKLQSLATSVVSRFLPLAPAFAWQKKG